MYVRVLNLVVSMHSLDSHNTAVLNLVVLEYEIMSSRMVAQPLAGRFAPILGDNDLAYGSR
jgi:hypothetical protein